MLIIGHGPCNNQWQKSKSICVVRGQLCTTLTIGFLLRTGPSLESPIALQWRFGKVVRIDIYVTRNRHGRLWCGSGFRTPIVTLGR
jgi:hypothetical protein